MYRLFGRNKSAAPTIGRYAEESRRVLEAVGAAGKKLPIVEPLGEYVAWQGYSSIFQQTAFEDQYGDIIVELARIESRVCFED